MNPRIQEIADRAGIFQHFNITDTASQDAKLLETFAALVLAECFMQAHVVADKYKTLEDFGESVAAARVAFAIAQHFKAET